jgi:hypothetical protein
MSVENILVAVLFVMVSAPVFIISATEAWGDEMKRKNAARVRAMLEEKP